MDGEFVDPLRTFWRGKRVIEGIDAHEDARFALDHGLTAFSCFNNFRFRSIA
jgi:hypothetical protein